MCTVHGATEATWPRKAGLRNGEEAHMATRRLTLRDVTGMTALSRSAVYAQVAESPFPKSSRIGIRAVRLVEQEVLDSIASRPRAGSDRPAA